jgi:hypothetical protein
MAATDLAAVTAALTDLVGSDLQAITFKWVARHFNIPYDTSKRVLFEFLSKQGQVRFVKFKFIKKNASTISSSKYLASFPHPAES